MAYANSITFYGWLKNDAVQTVQYILKDDKIKSPQFLFENKKEIEEHLSKKISNDKIKLKINKFEGGLSSDTFEIYLFFGKQLSHESCGDDDISDASFTLEDIKNFIDMSFAIKNITNPKNKPKLINLIVSDTK